MDSLLIFHVLIAFGAFQALFLVIIFLTNKNLNLPNKCFSVFLLIEGLTLVERLLAETNLMVEVPHLLGVSYPISFIKAPILFLMALAIVDPKFRLRKIHALHLIVFVLMLLLNIPFYMLPAERKLEMVSAFLTYIPGYKSFNFWFFLSFFFHIGAYMTASILALRRYQVHVKNNKLANWYLWVLYLYSVLLTVSLVYFIVRPSGLIEIPIINTISMLMMTFLIQSVAYSFLSESNVFNQSETQFINNIDQLIKDEKSIRKKLELEKAFLDDSLNLDDFAKSLNLSKKYVSDLINQKFGDPFKVVINQHRVEHAKMIMAQETNSEIQLITIGQESGFNNKVSFYRAFKRHTGKSPSDYFEGLKKQPFKQ